MTRRFVPSKDNPIAVAGLVVLVLVVIGLLADGRGFIQALVKGIALGSVYAIIALGFVLIFKATRTINFAQGALAMCGALFVSFLAADGKIPFTSWDNPLVAGLRMPSSPDSLVVSGGDRGGIIVLSEYWLNIGGPDWLKWFLCVFVALVFAALLGLVLERLTIRPMVGEPLFSVAVITLGLEIVLRVFATDTVKISFRSLAIPWGTDSFKLAGMSFNWSYVAIIITAALSFVAVYLFYRSRMGIAMRAVSYDQEAAMAQGINVGRVFAIAWAAGAVLAAIGGIFGTQPPVDQTGSLDPESSLLAFRALPAVILGGLDSAQGALLGGLMVGTAEIMAGSYLADYNDQLGSGYTLIVPYVVMIIGLLVKPYGLFGTPEVRRV